MEAPVSSSPPPLPQKALVLAPGSAKPHPRRRKRPSYMVPGAQCNYRIMQGKRQGKPCAVKALYDGADLPEPDPVNFPGYKMVGMLCKRHYNMLFRAIEGQSKSKRTDIWIRSEYEEECKTAKPAQLLEFTSPGKPKEEKTVTTTTSSSRMEGTPDSVLEQATSAEVDKALELVLQEKNKRYREKSFKRVKFQEPAYLPGENWHRYEKSVREEPIIQEVDEEASSSSALSSSSSEDEEMIIDEEAQNSQDEYDQMLEEIRRGAIGGGGGGGIRGLSSLFG